MNIIKLKKALKQGKHILEINFLEITVVQIITHQLAFLKPVVLTQLAHSFNM